jgi:hypothetical protein
MSTFITSTTGPCNIITYDNTSLATSGDLSDVIEYFNFIVEILGIDITFEEFKNMNSNEKKSFIRDIKIKKILDVNN